MSKKTLNQIKTLLGLEVKLEQVKTSNGVVLEAESFEPGMQVFIVNESERVPVPPGEFELEGGQVLVVVEEGVISELRSQEAQEEPKEQEMEQENPVKKIVESQSKETHFSEDKKEETVEVFFNDQAKAELKEMFTAWYKELSAEPKEEVKEEVKEELSKVEPIKHSPENKGETVRFNFKTNRPTRQQAINKFLFE